MGGHTMTTDMKPSRLQLLIPPLEHRLLRVVTFVVFLALIIAHNPLLLRRPGSDLDRPVPTSDDSGGYQRLAVNLLHGHGFSGTILEPLESYHLDLTAPAGRDLEKRYREHGPERRTAQFYRAPGFPALLSATYALFGNQPRNARRMLAVLAGATPVLLLVTGAVLAGWVGTTAAGLSGLYTLAFSPALRSLSMGQLLTEIPAAFLFALFCLVFVIFHKKRHPLHLCAAAVCMACFVLTRANFIPALPLLLLYLWFVRKRDMVVFGVVALVPIIAWATYATASTGRPVLLTTQGEVAFPSCNSIDVLEGVGPNREGRGYWHPDTRVDEHGVPLRVRQGKNREESGWVKGMLFWVNHFDDLPRLFYVKLRLGFWYDGFWHDRNGVWCKFWGEGFYLVGIAFLLMCIGFRPPRAGPAILPGLSSARVLCLQLLLLCALFVVWNQFAFWLVELIWLAMALLAWLRPYGDVYRLPFPNPGWFLAFVLSHAVATMLFIGVRYHWPLDPVLLMLSFLGVGLTAYELLRRHVPLAVVFVAVLAFSMAFRHVLSPEGLLGLLWSVKGG